MYEETAVIQVRPQADVAVTKLFSEALKLEEYAGALVIASDDNIQGATNDLSLIAGLKKSIEEKRKEYVQPINEHLTAVNEAFKGFTQPLVNADKITRGKILDYRAEQDRQRREQEEINRLRMEAAQKEMELKGQVSEPVSIVQVEPEQPTRYRADAGTLGTVKIRKYRVVNFADLPDQYKLENSVLLNKVVKAGIPEISGVEIYEEEVLRVTPKK